MLSNQIATALTKYYDWWTEQSTQQPYGFVFYSTSLLDYGGCKVFTEEGLEQVAEKYKKIDYYSDKSIQELKNDLRWSPCDSPNHMTNETIFSDVCDSLGELSEKLYEMNDDDLQQALSRAYEEVVQGILKFRTQRLPIERSEILVTMLWGDMASEEAIRFIRSCNEQVAAERYIRELGLGTTNA